MQKQYVDDKIKFYNHLHILKKEWFGSVQQAQKKDVLIMGIQYENILDCLFFSKKEKDKSRQKK